MRSERGVWLLIDRGIIVEYCSDYFEERGQHGLHWRPGITTFGYDHPRQSLFGSLLSPSLDSGISQRRNGEDLQSNDGWKS